MGTARKGPDEATEVDPVDDGGEAGGRWVKALILRVLQQQPPDDSYNGY